MKSRRIKTPQLAMRCINCKTKFIRYNYGVGRRRLRRWGKSQRKGNPYYSTPHAKITDGCMQCGGAVKQIE